MTVSLNQAVRVLVWVAVGVSLGQRAPEAQDAQTKAERLYAQAKHDMDEGNYEAAAQKLRQAIAAKPQSGDCWYLLGQAYHGLGRLDKAGDAYFEALLHLPNGGETQRKVLERLRELADGMPVPEPEPSIEQQLEKAWTGEEWARVADLGAKVIKSGANSPSYVDAHFYVGRAHLELRDPVQAAEKLRRYLQLAPNGRHAEQARALIEELDNDLFYSYVARIENALDQGHLDTARDLIDKARRIRSAGADLIYLEGLAFVLDGQDAKAIEKFEEYLRNAPGGRFAGSCERWIIYLRHPWIVVIQDDRVVRLHSDGTMPRPLSGPEQGKVEQALVSPDGRLVAFVGWNANRNTRNVFIADAFGNKVTGVFQSTGFPSQVTSLHWFEHERGTCLTFVGEDQRSKNYGVFVFEVEGSNKQAFMVPDSETPAFEAGQLRCQWSPDAEHLAWIGAGRSLWVCQASEVRVALRIEERFPVVDFAWGGRWQAGRPGFLIWTDGHTMYKRDVSPTFLTDGPPVPPYIRPRGVKMDELGVSADASIVAAFDRTARTLWVWLAQSCAPLPTITDVDAFAFSDVGTQLAYRTSQGVYITNLVARMGPRYVDGTMGGTQFAWSPVSLELLVWQDDYARLTIDGRFVAGGAVAEPGPFVRPRWSPDATRLAIQKNPGTADEPGAVWVLTRAAPEAKQLHRALAGDRGPFWLAGWAK